MYDAYKMVEFWTTYDDCRWHAFTTGKKRLEREINEALNEFAAVFDPEMLRDDAEKLEADGQEHRAEEYRRVAEAIEMRRTQL